MSSTLFLLGCFLLFSIFLIIEGLRLKKKALLASIDIIFHIFSNANTHELIEFFSQLQDLGDISEKELRHHIQKKVKLLNKIGRISLSAKDIEYLTEEFAFVLEQIYDIPHDVVLEYFSTEDKKQLLQKGYDLELLMHLETFLLAFNRLLLAFSGKKSWAEVISFFILLRQSLPSNKDLIAINPKKETHDEEYME